MLSKFSRFCRQCLAICLRIDALVRRVSAAKTVDEDVKGVGFQPIIAHNFGYISRPLIDQNGVFIMGL